VLDYPAGDDVSTSTLRYLSACLRTRRRTAGTQRPDALYADRDDGLLFATAAGDAPVALPQEGVGPPGGHGGLPQHAGQVGVAMPGGVLAFLLTCRLLDARGELGPRGQGASGGKAAHVGADLGEDHLRGGPADPQ
jgi:hypothetical protein